MKNQLLVIVLAAILMAESLLPRGAGLSQDFKFGEVVAHFQIHQDCDNISFSDFIWMHYAAESTHKQQQHHDNLPCLDSHHLLFAISHHFHFTKFTTAYHVVELENLFISHYHNWYNFLYTYDFLNPPRVA